ncbi:MAG: hypothetical protein KDD44_00370 [Bdellovibrionales bacterium]|nr:hypothetical protein [Bdellovibrionales bacterium]
MANVDAGNRYSDELLTGIFELGRMYYEMGYTLPAERIFRGLIAVDRGGRTPAALGLALLMLERGQYADSAMLFQQAAERGIEPIRAELGACAALLADGHSAEAKRLLVQVGRSIEERPAEGDDLRRFWEALALRVDRAD